MSTYIPDTWKVLKFSRGDNTPVYKVFAGWYGGYAGSDSWKLNSGIVSVKQCNDRYEFLGSSGSTYVCYMPCEKLSVYQLSILEYWRSKTEHTGARIELVDSNEFLTAEYN